jgi:hypothetical protein
MSSQAAHSNTTAAGTPHAGSVQMVCLPRSTSSSPMNDPSFFLRCRMPGSGRWHFWFLRLEKHFCAHLLNLNGRLYLIHKSDADRGGKLSVKFMSVPSSIRMPGAAGPIISAAGRLPGRGEYRHRHRHRPRRSRRLLRPLSRLRPHRQSRQSWSSPRLRPRRLRPRR